MNSASFKDFKQLWFWALEKIKFMVKFGVTYLNFAIVNDSKNVWLGLVLELELVLELGLPWIIWLQSGDLARRARTPLAPPSDPLTLVSDTGGARPGWSRIKFKDVGGLASEMARMVEERNVVKMSIDSGMVVVVFISLMYMGLVFGLLFYVKNDWCDLLFKNFTVKQINFVVLL